jgi:hypothetical protein
MPSKFSNQYGIMHYHRRSSYDNAISGRKDFPVRSVHAWHAALFTTSFLRRWNNPMAVRLQTTLESMMKDDQNKSGKLNDKSEDENMVERIAKKIVPPSTEVSDQELKNPGEMTPDARPTENRS